MYLGKLIGISPQHLIIQADLGQKLTLDEMPAIGNNIIDRNHTHIGKLTDVFGPVDRPLFSVKPLSQFDIQSFESQQGDLFYSIRPGPATVGRKTRGIERSRSKGASRGAERKTFKPSNRNFDRKSTMSRKTKKDSNN